MSERPKILEISTLKSMLLVLGAYIFSYCLSLVIHETGHAIALLIIGAPEVSIHAHPFALSWTGHTGFAIPSELMPFVRYMGPFFNIICATIITLTVWRKRNPKLLPLLMCAGTAFIMEGVGVITDLAVNPESSDWGRVMIDGGVSPIILGIMCVLFLVTGSIFLLLLMPVFNVSSLDSYWRKFLISLGFPVYFALSVIYVSIFDPLWLDNRLIALFSAIGFSFLLTALYKPVFPFLDRLSHTDTSTFNWSAVVIAFGAAVTIISIELIFFS